MPGGWLFSLALAVQQLPLDWVATEVQQPQVAVVLVRVVQAVPHSSEDEHLVLDLRGRVAVPRLWLLLLELHPTH